MTVCRRAWCSEPATGPAGAKPHPYDELCLRHRTEVEAMLPEAAARLKAQRYVRDFAQVARTPKPRRWSQAKCGTHAGYSLHVSHHTPICEPCLEAHKTYQRNWRRARAAS